MYSFNRYFVILKDLESDVWHIIATSVRPLSYMFQKLAVCDYLDIPLSLSSNFEFDCVSFDSLSDYNIIL